MFIPRPKQQEVLAYTRGKMGVSAVPGSGKTETLAHLAAQIVSSGQLHGQQEVLIVTLVNSAVDNFYRRVSSLVRERGLLPHVGYRVRTLHGLSHDIVRERPALVGLADDFVIVDERAADEILDEVTRAWLRSHANSLDDYFIAELEASKQDWIRREHLPGLVKEIGNSFIRYAKDRQLTPDALRERLESRFAPLSLADMGCAMYADYQRALAYRGAVDFDDLIRLALQALALDAGLLERLRERWPYVLEDEAQDSSRLQEAILRTLVGPEGNWVRVGDPNQAIYETFTTASPYFLRRFLQEPDVDQRELPNSGRSTLSIIALANHLIDWTQQSHPEPAVRDALSLPHIEPTPPGDPQPNPPDDPTQVYLIAQKYSPQAELQAVVDSLARWLPHNSKRTVAVLVPRNDRASAVVDALKARGLDVVESLLRATTSTRETAGALARLLRYLAEPTRPRRLAAIYEVWRRVDREDSDVWQQVQKTVKVLQRCRQVEDFTAPRAGRDWLEEELGDDPAHERLLVFRQIVQRWQGTLLLPVDQIVLTLAQDVFTEPAQLAVAHKLAVTLRQAADDHPGWRLPELADELVAIARNRRRFLGLSDDDTGFDPERHRGKVVVATMHKAKGLEWDRVYLMSVNNYDFPSAQPYDNYIAEKWFVRDSLNLDAEARAQLEVAVGEDDNLVYRERIATEAARLDYVRERLRLLYVGITRAREDLVITWNTGRQGEAGQALPLVALRAFWEDYRRELAD